MKAVVSTSHISGVVPAPPGKSLMQRACALALLNNGVTRIFNPGKSEDDLAAISIIQQLGAHVTSGERLYGSYQQRSNQRAGFAELRRKWFVVPDVCSHCSHFCTGNGY
jgi:5-enolpyruvylshikimate-3-phosphate synthase